MTGSTTRNDSMRRLHPVSLVFEFASILRANVIPTVAAIVSSSRGGWIGAAIGAAVFGIGITIAIIRFVTFRYRMTSDELIVDSGLIHRVHRTIPTDKIQNIDLSQNVFHRILRVGEVRIETASGKEPEAVMRVIAIQEYLRLRSELFSYRNLELAQLPETGLNVQSSSDTKTESPELVLALSTKAVVPPAVCSLASRMPLRLRSKPNSRSFVTPLTSSSSSTVSKGPFLQV